MPRTKAGSHPSYRLHRPTGQAVVTLYGRDRYLGRYGSAESKKKYLRLIQVWLANQEDGGDPATVQSAPAKDDPSINELILGFLNHASGYYQATDGEKKELGCITDALAVLKRLYGRDLASGFGPKALKEVRAAMLEKGWARGYVNHQISRVRRMFRWATEEELLRSSVYHALIAVRGLRRGMPGVRESKRIRPARIAAVKAVLNRVGSMLKAMIRFQLWTGCRPGEVCRLKPKRIKQTGSVWVYRPGRHKTAHHGKKRKIFIGPRAQKVLKPWLKNVAPNEYVFSPIRAEAMRQAERRANRKTPLWPSHVSRLDQKRKTSPLRPKKQRYDTASYRRAIKRACKNAKVASWTPNQLRHNAATRLRKKYGIELARIILGHATGFTTEVYAERDWKAAMEAMKSSG